MRKNQRYRRSAIRAGRGAHFEQLEQRTVLSGGGLVGQYFHNEDFTGLAYEQTEAVNFDWGDTSPAPGVNSNTFSVRWTGQVEAQHSEQYTFYTTSNQGVRLWVDGKLLIDNWEPHNTEVDSATISLTAGQRYDIRLDYYEQYGAAEIQLEWSSATQLREIVPTAHLYASPQGLFGQYADTFGGSASRVDPTLDFNWGTGRPHPSVAVDQFNVKWTGQIRPDHSEEYTFSILSDEGVRLWIGGELVIDDWDAHTAQTATGTKMLEAGKWYDIRIEYFDRTGAAQVSLSWSGAGQTGGLVEAVPAANLQAAKPTELTFSNPVGPGQDPYVTRWNDSYLHVRSWGRSVYIDKANSLEDIHPNNPASSTVTAWTAPIGTDYSEQIWAPEIHHINGKWYIYVAASDGDNATHRMYVLERDDPNPMGAYVFRGQLAATTDRWAIDGTVLDWEGQLYFIWSGWAGTTDGQQNLYIAEMSDPMTISGERYLIATPDYAWEKHGLSINEGPQVLIHNGRLHIIYSGSAYWRHEYALGRLSYDGVGSLLDKASWQKSPTPVFQQSGDIVGTGHASFTTSPDGSQNWIVYHAHHDADNFQDDRDIYIQPFTFSGTGLPVFGTPIPASIPQTVPYGTADPERPFLVGDFDASGAVDQADYEVWRLSYGLTIAPGVGADANRNGVIDAGDYTVWRDNVGVVPPVQDPTVAYWRHEERAGGQLVASGANSVLDSSGEGNHMRTFDSSSTAASYSTNVSPLPLRSGLANTRSLDFGPGGDGAGRNDDNYTESKPINTKAFEALTVEFAFRLDSVTGFQSLFGKDGAPVSSPVAPLQIKVRGDSFPGGAANQLFVEWIDGDGDVHFLASGFSITTGVWNHIAFVLEDDSAQLFVAGETGAYEIVDAIYGADFSGPSGQVLYVTNSNFTVGRGAYNGNAADWADARIDEVRVSDAALQPNKFLFVPNLSPSTAQIIAAGTSQALTEAPEVQFVMLSESASETPAAKPTRTSAAAIRIESFHAAIQLLLLTSESSLNGDSSPESMEYETLLDEEFEEQTVDTAFAALCEDYGRVGIRP
jgi:GH43 family beta-xylosidase